MNICGGKLISHKIPFGGIFFFISKNRYQLRICSIIARIQLHSNRSTYFSVLRFDRFMRHGNAPINNIRLQICFYFGIQWFPFVCSVFRMECGTKFMNNIFFFLKNTSFMPESCRFHVNYLLIDCSYCVGLEL